MGLPLWASRDASLGVCWLFPGVCGDILRRLGELSWGLRMMSGPSCSCVLFSCVGNRVCLLPVRHIVLSATTVAISKYLLADYSGTADLPRYCIGSKTDRI
eukprot:2721570-Pyramimonas_sp.AAC.1